MVNFKTQKYGEVRAFLGKKSIYLTFGDILKKRVINKITV